MRYINVLLTYLLTYYDKVGTSFFRCVTIHAFDRQTDRQGPECRGNTVRCITCRHAVAR